MNLPNKLTVLRIVLILPFLLVLYLDVPGASYIALAIFIIASLTDLLDGKIARSRNLVTDFGKFADPLADKMLVVAAMLWFVENGQMPGWALLIVILREFAVSGLRMVASDQGRVIAAGWSGKVKTASTMVCIVLMFLPIPDLVNTLCVAVIVVTTPLVRGGVLCQKPGLPAGYVTYGKQRPAPRDAGPALLRTAETGAASAPDSNKILRQKFYFWPSIRLQVGPLLGIIGVRDTNRVKSWRHEKRREDVTKNAASEGPHSQ